MVIYYIESNFKPAETWYILLIGVQISNFELGMVSYPALALVLWFTSITTMIYMIKNKADFNENRTPSSKQENDNGVLALK